MRARPKKRSARRPPRRARRVAPRSAANKRVHDPILGVTPQAPRDPITAYAQDVLAGRIAACRFVKLAAKRHLDDLKLGPKRGLRFDLFEALHAIRFFGFLTQSKGEFAGKPLTLQPWQKFIVGSVHGWRRIADGTRRFRTLYCEVPKKNGKSTLAAGLALHGLVADNEPGAEIYAAATKRDQARLVFDEAKRMVRRSKLLQSRIGVFRSNMSVDATASKFEPLAADSKYADGLNPHLAVVDELHRHRNADLLNILQEGMGGRRQPLTVIITTAGDEDPESAYAHEHDYAADVLEGAVQDDSYFAIVFTIDKGDKWDDPKAWAKANPNLGISPSLRSLEERVAKARHSPKAKSDFMRFRLDVRQSSAQSLIDLDVWAANCTGRPINTFALAGRRCFIGADLSSKLDLSCIMKLFPPRDETERWIVLPRFWLPEANLPRKADKDRAPYLHWVEQGWIETTSGNIIDHAVIKDAIEEERRIYDIVTMRYDPWNATQFALEVQELGVEAVEFVQGLKSYNEPTKEFLALLEDSRIDHGSNPVLTWMARHVKAQTDKNENMMPNKAMSRKRIDGITALIMALGGAMKAAGTGDGKSVYERENRGLTVIG